MAFWRKLVPARFGRKSEKPTEQHQGPRAPVVTSSQSCILARQGLRLTSELGEGGFGKVYKASVCKSDRVVAVKVVARNGADSDACLETEISALGTLNHPNIIQLVETFCFKDSIYIVMEYAENGTLLSYLQKNPSISEATIKKLFKQVSAAVEFCHSNSIAHRDLKLENILVCKNSTVKLADFGLAFVDKKHSEKSLCTTFCGTLQYMAPELAACIAYNPMAADVWSLGIVLYVMNYRQFPFVATSPTTLLKNQLSDKLSKKLKRNSGPSIHCKVLLRGMLETTVENRLTMKDVMASEWLKEDSISKQ